MTAERTLIDRYAENAAGPDLPGLKAVQSERAAHLVRRLSKPHGVAVLGDPVGTGKTVIALTVAARLLAKGTVQRVVILTPNEVVARIWRERSEHFNGAFKNETLRIHSVMGKHGVPMTVKKPALIVVDEAHRKQKRDFVRQLIQSGPGGGSHRRLFLTATPFQIAVSDLHQLIELGDREGITAPVADALSAYGRTVTKLAHQAHDEPNAYIAAQLRQAADDWSAKATRVLMPQLTPAEEKKIGLTGMPFPRKVDVPLGTDSWSEAFHVARLIPELAGDPAAPVRATDSFQRGLSSSIAAFWESAAAQPLRTKRFAALGRELEQRLGESTDHPKVAFTVDWVTEQVRRNSHVAIFCVWNATARELRDAIAERLDDEQLVGEVQLPGDSISDSVRTRFRDRKAEPLVLILQERFSESIDLDGGNPALVHHDLPWNPARLRQRWGRFVRASSKFTPIPPDKVIVPVLAHETDRRVYETVKVRAGIGDVLLSDPLALHDTSDGDIDPVDWVLRNLRQL